MAMASVIVERRRQPVPQIIVVKPMAKPVRPEANVARGTVLTAIAAILPVEEIVIGVM